MENVISILLLNTVCKQLEGHHLRQSCDPEKEPTIELTNGVMIGLPEELAPKLVLKC